MSGKSDGDKSEYFVISQSETLYQQALERMFSVWKQESPCEGGYRCKCGKCSNNDGKPALLSEDNPLIRKYQNEVIGMEGLSELAWIDYSKEKFGTFDYCLSLGSGGGSLEKNMLEKGFVERIDTVDIVENPGLGSHLVGDLNFINLPPEKYDIIVCKGTLPYIVNKEYLLYQINSSLKDNGVFILKDYVGESKFQWSDSKIDYINSRMFDKFGKAFAPFELSRSSRIFWNESPFDGLGGEEIPNLINYYFSESKLYEHFWGGISYPLIRHFSRIGHLLKGQEDLIVETLNYAIKLDKELEYSDQIIPCIILGAYRKSGSREIPEVRKWSIEEIDYHCSLKIPHVSLLQRINRKIKRLIKKYFSTMG